MIDDWPLRSDDTQHTIEKDLRIFGSAGGLLVVTRLKPIYLLICHAEKQHLKLFFSGDIECKEHGEKRLHTVKDRMNQPEIEIIGISELM